MQQFTQDGVIYEELGDGNVRVVGYADAPAQQPGFVQTRPADPFKRPQDAAQLESTQTGAARTRQLMAQDAATAPFDAQKAAADARKAVLEADKLQRELDAGPVPKTQAAMRQRAGKLQALERQISRVEELYQRNIAPTSGLSGIADYLPTEANRQFDTAAAGLAEQGLAAFRVPGVGAQSDTELRQFVQANKPSASDFDVSIEEKLMQLRSRLSSEQEALGIAPTQQRDDAAAATMPGGSAGGGDGPVRFYGGGPSTLTAATDAFRTESNPEATAALDAMIRSGMPVEQINQALAAQFRANPVDAASVATARQFLQSNPQFRGPIANVTRTIPVSEAQQAAGSLAENPLGAYFANAANSLSFNTLDNMTADPAMTRAGLDMIQQQSPTASMLGAISGGVLGAGGAELAASRLGLQGARAALAGDGVFGAASGAGATDTGNRAVGAATGGLAGVGGGLFGRGAARRIGSAVGGVRNAAVDELRTRGVPLTVGQTLSQSGRLGGMIKGVEDRLSGVPIVGDMVNARRLEGLEGFNRAAADEALAPIGANSGGVLGEEGVARSRGLVSRAYDDAVGGVRVQADAPFVGDMQGAFQRADVLPEAMSGNARYTLNTRVGESFDPTGGMTGGNFQQSLRGLRRDASAVRNQPYGYDFGNVTRQAEDALTGMMQRQAPEVVPALNAANQAYGRTGIVRDAVNAARNGSQSGQGGVFTPAQLAGAASANARRFGGNQGTPDAPFYALNNAARDVLPNRVPDSGTAGRLALLALPGLGGAGTDAAGLTESGAATGLGVGAALTAGGTRAGQQAMVAALTRRNDAMRRASDAIMRQQRVGGLFGAAMLPLALPSQ